MKERANQLADDHWDKYISPLVCTHSDERRFYSHDEMLNIAKFHYKTATIHGHGHGVEDERNRAKNVSNAAFENLAPITAYSEAAAMDTSTGYLALAANAPKVVAGMADCVNFDASTCVDCHHCDEYVQAPPTREPLDLRLPSYALPCTLDEICEKLDEEVSEWQDTPNDSLAELLEAWDCVQVAQTYMEHGGNDYEISSLPAEALQGWHEKGRDVMKAKKITMIKLAARAKYSPADCARILANV